MRHCSYLTRWIKPDSWPVLNILRIESKNEANDNSCIKGSGILANGKIAWLHKRPRCYVCVQNPQATWWWPIMADLGWGLVVQNANDRRCILVRLWCARMKTSTRANRADHVIGPCRIIGPLHESSGYRTTGASNHHLIIIEHASCPIMDNGTYINI